MHAGQLLELRHQVTSRRRRRRGWRLGLHGVDLRLHGCHFGCLGLLGGSLASSGLLLRPLLLGHVPRHRGCSTGKSPRSWPWCPTAVGVRLVFAFDSPSFSFDLEQC